MDTHRNSSERFDTVVIGGGQAGLTIGYHLAQQGRSFVILDANERVGDAWRKRWESLRLFTPARYDGLAGMRFPGPGHVAPTKDQFADYLEAYAGRFELPVRTGIKVDGLSKQDGTFVVTAGAQRFEADRVVVATGAHNDPWVPAFADQLDPQIVQLHSKDYRSPSQLRDGGVLIVGVGNSGADIGLEVARTHPTWLAGKESGHIPARIDGFFATRVLVRIVRFMGHHVLTRRTPIGRKIGPKLVARGAPLIRVKPKDLVSAGIERVARVAGVRDGLPVLDDGRVLDVANVIWCTGFRQTFSWIDLPVAGDHGELLHDRGVATTEPGLYFVGLLFQYGMTSDVITGVGRDAEYIAKRIASESLNGAQPKRALVKA